MARLSRALPQRQMQRQIITKLAVLPPVAAPPLVNKRISAMHFQRVWEPTAMGPS